MQILARLYTAVLRRRLAKAKDALEWIEQTSANEIKTKRAEVRRISRALRNREAGPGASITAETIRRDIEREAKGVLL